MKVVLITIQLTRRVPKSYGNLARVDSKLASISLATVHANSIFLGTENTNEIFINRKIDRTKIPWQSYFA